MTVKDAIKYIRNDTLDKKDVDTCFIIDNNRKLKGTLHLKELILNNEKTFIEDIMTNTEYKILLMLISNPQKVFTRIEILERLEEGYYENDDRAVDSHIKKLRKKRVLMNLCKNKFRSILFLL